MLNSKLLQHFVCVFEHSSLTKAAQALGVTQSSVSKSINKLETQLNLQLFHRHTRAISPTLAANQLYTDACRCLVASEDFIAKASALNVKDSGIIKVGCGPLAYDLIIKPLIDAITQQQLGIRIHAETGRFEQLKQRLDNHHLDCVFYDVGELTHIADPANYHVVPLIKAPVYLVANDSHPVHTHQDIMKHVFNYSWVLPPIPQRYIEHFPKEFQEFILNSETPDFQVTDLH